MKRFIERIYCGFFGHFRAKLLFASCGKSSYIIRPLRVRGGKDVAIGSGVSILDFLRIETWREDKSGSEPCIIIGDRTNIEQNVHITAGESVIIEKECSIFAGVMITDMIHPYDDIHIASKFQKKVTKPVFVGSQSQIGIGARIMPGVRIGRHCIIGTNAVVTRDIPDYSVAAGIPAKVIKQYDFTKNKWVKK